MLRVLREGEAGSCRGNAASSYLHNSGLKETVEVAWCDDCAVVPVAGKAHLSKASNGAARRIASEVE
jgi:hypothetical protein